MLGALPTWVTFSIGVILIAAGIAVGEPIPIILGPLFLMLAGARYAFTSSTEKSAKRMEVEAPLGPPVKSVPNADELSQTLRLSEGRVAVVMFGALMVFMGLGAWATYGADPASLLGVPFVALGGFMAAMAWRKRIDVSSDEVRFIGFRPWTVRMRWAETRALGRGLAREGSLFRDPRFSAFAISTGGEKLPLPVTDADPGAFEWLAAHARERGVDVPPEEPPPA